VAGLSAQCASPIFVRPLQAIITKASKERGGCSEVNGEGQGEWESQSQSRRRQTVSWVYWLPMRRAGIGKVETLANSKKNKKKRRRWYFFGLIACHKTFLGRRLPTVPFHCGSTTHEKEPFNCYYQSATSSTTGAWTAAAVKNGTLPMETSTSGQQPGGRKSARGHGEPKRGSDAKPKPNLHGMRRSCDQCGRSKKGCDGGRPCR